VFPGFSGIFDIVRYLQMFLLPLTISPSKVVNEFEGNEIEEMENGDLMVSSDMPEDNWLIGYLLSFGTQVTVIEPAYLQKILSDEAKKIYEKNKA